MIPSVWNKKGRLFIYFKYQINLAHTIYLYTQLKTVVADNCVIMLAKHGTQKWGL